MNWYKISKKKWERSNWVEMLEKAFSVMDHTKGPFKRSTDPYLGNVAFMNEAQNIRIDLMANLYPFGGAEIFVNTSTPEKLLGKKLKVWSAEEFKRMPYDIVKEVYEMIDDPYYGRDPNEDDFDSDDPEDLDPYSDPSGVNVNVPVYSVT